MEKDILLVSLCGTLVGRLLRTRRGARFVYEEEIVREHAGQPLLSLSLPVKERPYAEGRTGSWFRGLLPEGRRLEAIARHIGCDGGDYVRILGCIGWECAGAVSIADDRLESPRGGAPLRLEEDELAQRLRNLPTYVAMAPTARVSLGGYQEKLVVIGRNVCVRDGRIEDAQWFDPDDSSPSTHIIKPQPEGRYPGLAEAEAWAMGVSAHAARCARTALMRPKDGPVSIVVERFDRAWRDGACERVHQEDCCQALGLDPADKYARTDRVRGNDPTYARIARLLAAYAEDPGRETAELLRQIVVSVVLGNVDAHAKNYALLYRKLGVPEVSPLYDVVPVVDVEPRARHLSMRIAGEVLLEDVDRSSILEEARGWGMEAGRAESVLDDTLVRLREGIARMRDCFPEAAIRHERGAAARAARLGA